ncbi:MAG: hypothetical protein ABIH39_00595 [Candidatus Margulisiibacteriota bacterium]
MKLPRNNKKLDEIFKNGRTPELSELNGEYYVDMLTVLPSLKRFAHRKIFYHVNNAFLGHNILFENKIWGHFFVEDGICENPNPVKTALINYNKNGNTFIINKIRDHVRCVSDDKALYLGRFNCKIGGRLFFLGYFSLSKI